MITRRKRNILEMAVATACFGAAAVLAAMPATALAAPQNTNAQTAAQNRKAKKKVANERLLPVVVVNGYLSSIQNAIAIQKNSNSIVEAISAQDIGRLPGTSIAASLQQLPGVNVQMVGGRPQAVNVHGLGQDFSTALLDGVEQVTTAQNRGVHFNQYPPGWFKSIKVYISPQADLIGQGMAATFAMKTWRPLEEPHREVALNVDYRWVSPGNLMPGPGVNDKGYGINGMYINQFDDRRFGVALGVDLDVLPSKRLREAPWGAPGGYPTDTAGDIVPGGDKIYNYSSLRKRDAYFATFEYRPSRAYSTTLDLSYEDYHKTTQRKGMEIPMWWSSSTLSTIGPVSNGFVESGTFTNVYPIIRNGYTHHKDRLYNIHWGNKFRFADNWTAGLDASYNEAMRNYEKLESYSGYGYDGPASNGAISPISINFSYAPDGQMILTSPANFDASNIVLTDPQGWGAGAGASQEGFLNEQHNEEYLANFKLTAQHYFEHGPISSVEFGADYAHHHKNNNIYQWFMVVPGSCSAYGNPTVIGACSAPIPSSALQSPQDALGFMGLGTQVLYNPNSLLASGATTLIPTALSSLQQSPEWTLHEDDTYGFVQFNIQTNLGQDVGLRGNFGVQIAHTSQESRGQRLAPGSTAGGTGKIVLLPMSGGTTFTRVLPSMNLVFSFPHNYDARLGIARTMARPKMSDMSAGMYINTNVSYLSNTNPNQSYFSGGGGNPALLPTMATNYNISFERYFRGFSGGFHCAGSGAQYSSQCRTGATGYVQLSGFYLNVSDYINESAASIYNFSSFESGYLTPAQQQLLGTSNGTFTVPENNGSGKVYGAQLAANVPLMWGFGVMGSATLSKSAIYYAGSMTPVSVEGLAKWVQNYTLYYAHDGFQANVNFNSRTHALASLFGISASRVLEQQRAQHWISAQVSYEFSRGPAKGLTLIASGENLGNEVLEDYGNNDPRQVVRWEQYGRTFHIGFSYKLD